MKIEKIVEMHRLFVEFYNEGGVGVSKDYIQVDQETFINLVPVGVKIGIIHEDNRMELQAIVELENYSLKIISLIH